MKKSMRRIFCIVASLAVVLAFMPAITFADEIVDQTVMKDGKSVKVTFDEKVDDEKITVIDGTDYQLKDEDYSVSGKKVTINKEFVDGDTGYRPSDLKEKLEIHLKDGGWRTTKDIKFYRISKNLAHNLVDRVYNGKKRYAKLYMSGKKGRDYKIVYKQKKRKAIGTYTITVKGIGDYKGSFKESFKIIPKKPKVVSIKKTKTTATIKWKRVKNCSGYKVLLLRWHSEPDDDGDGGWAVVYKTATIKSKYRTSKKFTNVKKSKCDGFQIESYKVVKGKRIYSHSKTVWF